jgi:hypothetical protein
MSKQKRKTTKSTAKGAAGSGPDRPASERQFVKGLVIRGEAAKPEQCKLPSGATHEIVGESKKGEFIVKRRRFSAF